MGEINVFNWIIDIYVAQIIQICFYMNLHDFSPNKQPHKPPNHSFEYIEFSRDSCLVKNTVK